MLKHHNRHGNIQQPSGVDEADGRLGWDGKEVSLHIASLMHGKGWGGGRGRGSTKTTCPLLCIEWSLLDGSDSTNQQNGAVKACWWRG